MVFSVLQFILLICNCQSKNDKNEMVNLDSCTLYTKVKGTGIPTVIIENGLCCGTDLYEGLFDSVSKITQVLSYDHPGIGKSPKNKNPRTLKNYNAELKSLLEYKKIPPPYILVGHSMGGFIIRYFAFQYPDETVGLVFIDAPHEDWFTYIRSQHTPEELEFFNTFFNPGRMKNGGGCYGELSHYIIMCDSIRGKKIPSQIPVRMYTGTLLGEWAKKFGYNEADMAEWAKMQHYILEGVEDARQYADNDATHMYHLEKPDTVLNGIRDIIEKYRNRKCNHK
jgi:pimeloyl-ACP methyl ester carboxylesterase